MLDHDPAAPQSPLMRTLLALALATGGFHLARAALTVANIVDDGRVPSFSGMTYQGWSYILGPMFQALLPALLVAGVLGTWKRKEGARRLTVLSAGTLVLFATVELIMSLVPFAANPPQLVPALESLVVVYQSFVAGNGGLLQLVIALRRNGDARDGG